MKKMRKLLDLENLVYAGIMILPAYLIKIRFFGLSTNVLEIFIILILILWLLKKGYKNISIESYKKFAFPLFFALFGLSISSIFNDNLILEAGIIKGWFIFPIIFVFLISQIIEKDKIINIFKAFYLSSFLVSVVAIIFLFLGKVTYDGRLETFFNSPNYLAMYITPALIMLTQIREQKHKPGMKLFILISGLIMLTAFYFTFSYAAWVAIAVSLMITEMIRRRNIKFGKKTWLAIFILIIFFVFQFRETKLSDLVSLNSRSSLSSRIMIWQSVGKILKNHWILGIGPGNFQEKYLEYQKYYPSYLEWAVPHPHNLFMTFWLSGGILGLSGFIWLVILWFKEIIKKNNSTIKSIVLCLMLYILIHGIFDTTYFKNDLAVIFWINFLALKL